MEYEIVESSRYNHLYFSISDEDLLTVIYNKNLETFTVKINSIKDDKYIHHFKTRNIYGVPRVIEAFIFDRTKNIIEFDAVQLIKLRDIK